MSNSKPLGMKALHLRVPAKLFGKLKALADENGLPVASVARLAMIDYTRRHGAGSSPDGSVGRVSLESTDIFEKGNGA